jgi:hypothetical protein
MVFMNMTPHVINIVGVPAIAPSGTVEQRERSLATEGAST